MLFEPENNPLRPERRPPDCLFSSGDPTARDDSQSGKTLLGRILPCGNRLKEPQLQSKTDAQESKSLVAESCHEV
jgi:hypothetical protein